MTAGAVAIANDDTQFDLIRKTYSRDLNPQEFELLVAEAKHRNLSVINKELVAVKFKGVAQNFITLAGVRRLAERSGAVRGTEGPYWRGKTGGWTDAWLEDAPPAAAKFLVYRADSDMPYVGVAIWKERKQTKADGSLMALWASMPAHMLAKVAEMDAYKRARIVSESDPVSLEGDEENIAPDPVSVRVRSKQQAMNRAHAIASHEQVKGVVKAINPGMAESMTEGVVTPRDIDVAASLIEEFGPDAAYEVSKPVEDEGDPKAPSARELWRDDLRDAFKEWNRDTASYIREQLAGGGDDQGWMYADAIELAPTPTVRDRFINAAREDGVDEAVLDAAVASRADATQTTRAART